MTFDMIIAPGAFLSQKRNFWIADSAVCGHSIKRYQVDKQTVANQMGNGRCLTIKVWQLIETAS